MGDFRVTVEAVGGHGCGREVREGPMLPCGQPHCPDCQVRAFVAELKEHCSVGVAKIEHWPVPGAAGTTRDADPGPVDDLLAGTRTQGQGSNKF